MKTLLGCVVETLKIPVTLSLLKTSCRECGNPLVRTYAAVYTAQKEGRRCICRACKPPVKNYAKRLDEHREKLIERHAKTEPQVTAMRALLRWATDEEPLQLSSLLFWKRLSHRIPDVSENTKNAYYYHAKKAMGL